MVYNCVLALQPESYSGSALITNIVHDFSCREHIWRITSHKQPFQPSLQWRKFHLLSDPWIWVGAVDSKLCCAFFLLSLRATTAKFMSRHARDAFLQCRVYMRSKDKAGSRPKTFGTQCDLGTTILRGMLAEVHNIEYIEKAKQYGIHGSKTTESDFKVSSLLMDEPHFVEDLVCLCLANCMWHKSPAFKASCGQIGCHSYGEF